MIISPPFLPRRANGTTDADYLDAAMPHSALNCPGTSVPEGSFPVSLKLGWHGGTHLSAPRSGNTSLPVSSIADGQIVFARLPTAQVTDVDHPLNYNPFGSGAAWTDDGMVIIRHRTDIGAGPSAEGCEFYSVFAHLSSLSGNSAKVARGTATPAEEKIFRKDEIGSAGSIYGTAGHIHMEIVCDDVNLRKLFGRSSGQLSSSTDGRQDSVYGEVYFKIPSGTPLFADKPAANVSSPNLAEVERTSEDLIIGLRYANGEGAQGHRGSAWLSTYRTNGTLVGVPIEVLDADYNMFSTATEICDAFPAGGRPTPAAVYELLRFGRILQGSAESLVPEVCPHWREVRGSAGRGWVNLNAPGVRKFSDSDFPDWKGWKLVNDDTNDDSRAESVILTQVIEDSSNSDGKLSRAELEARLAMAEVREALSRCVCKFPSEWNRDSIDARWGWLQSSPDHGLSGDDWSKLRAHISALTVPSSELPGLMTGAHWHFHPQSFISHFRKCAWLSADEFKQLVPKHAMRRHNGVYLWEAVQTNLTAQTSIAVAHRVMVNRMARKYGVTSPHRLASFFGNSIQETQWLGLLSEIGGPTLWYAPWYGRGFLQLTNPENYVTYWRFRGRRVPEPLKNALTQAYNAIASMPPGQRSNSTLADTHFPHLTAEMRGWRDEVRGVAIPNSVDSTYAPADSAGFYWAKLRMAFYADADHILARVAVNTNQGGKVYYRSPSFWRASAAVNLPASVNNLYSNALNGFDARCVAYAYALAVLSETLFPDSSGAATLMFPEGYIPRR